MLGTCMCALALLTLHQGNVSLLVRLFFQTNLLAASLLDPWTSPFTDLCSWAVCCRLAASEDPVGVTAGGILGHAICTGVAVLGGRHLAAHINERTVQVR